MKTSEQGINLIKKFEGLRIASYLCPGRYETIGYGHLILKNEDYKSISSQQAEQLLIKDLDKFEKTVNNNIKVAVTQQQFDALISFTYNVGSGAFQRSTLRQKINYFASMEEIAQEFLRWVRIKGKISIGLYRRRLSEAQLYCS